MNIFLVDGRVSQTKYMGESYVFKELRLVKANSREEAEEKYQNYWCNKTVEYNVYYHADGRALQTVE
jgi:hypothetical protein